MKIRNKKIIVTGGAGFIGSNLVKSLVELENQVIVIDNFSQGKKENLKDVQNNKNLKIVKADILDFEKMFILARNVDIIFHLAVQCLRVSFKDPIYVHNVNATGTLNLLSAAHKSKVRKFIYCSSSEVYGTAQYSPMDENHPLLPTTVYGTSKLVGELYTRCFNDNFGLKTVIVRPFNTYGYNSHFIGPYGEVIPRFVIRVKNNLSPIIYGDGLQTRDFTFVTDTVLGIILAAENDDLVGQTVNIAFGKEVTIKRIAEIVIKFLNKKIDIKYEPYRPNDVRRHYADIKKAKKSLAFQPEISIEKGIAKYIEFLENRNVNFKEILKFIPDINW